MAFTIVGIAETVITAAIPASLGMVLVSKGEHPLLRWLGYWSIGLGALYLLAGLFSVPVSTNLF